MGDGWPGEIFCLVFLEISDEKDFLYRITSSELVSSVDLHFDCSDSDSIRLLPRFLGPH
jgi:hypothetical protein